MIRVLTLVVLGLGLAAGEARLITPPLDEIKNGIREIDVGIRRRAQAWLFYLTPAELADIRAYLRKVGGTIDSWPSLLAAEVSAGVMEHSAEVLVHLEPVMALLSDRELAPLCEAMVRELQRRTAQGQRLSGGTWTALAARTGHPGLQRLLVTALVADPGMTTVAPQPAATWLEVVAALPRDAPLPARLRVLQRAQPGFAQPPPATLAELLRDKEPELRRAAAALLGGSSDRSVLKLAAGLAGDPDPGVRGAAVNAILSFRPQPPPETLAALCDDARWEVWHRANAWTQRLLRPDKETLEAAKRQFSRKDCEPPVLMAISGGLAAAGEQAWVIERSRGFEPAVQSDLMLRLLGAADERVLDAVQGAIARNKDGDAARLVSGLSAAPREIDVFPLLLRCLEDKRGEVRQAAQRAIEQRASRPTPRAGAPAKETKPEVEAERIAALWRDWHATHRLPLDAAGEAGLGAAARGDPDAPLPLVLRWIGRDGEAGTLAMRALIASPRGADEKLWLAVLRDPQFALRAAEVAQGLAACTPGPALQQAVLDRLAGGESAFAETACAWRIDAMAARLTDLVLVKGIGAHAAQVELAVWWPQPVDTAVRTALAAIKPAQARPAYDLLQRATALVALRAELGKDAPLLVQLCQRADIDQSLIMPGVVQLAERGDAAATAALVKAISAKAQPAATGAALQALQRRAAAGSEPPAALRDQFRRLAGASEGDTSAEQRATAIALLAAAGDPTAPDLVRRSATAETWATLAQPLLTVTQRAAQPAVRELLLAAPDRAGEDRCRVWFERQTKLGAAELRALLQQARAARLEAADRLRGKPVEGLSAAVEVSGSLRPQRDGTAPITLVVTNHRREAFVLSPITTQAMMYLEGTDLCAMVQVKPGPGVPPSIRLAPSASARLPATIAYFPAFPTAARACFIVTVTTGLDGGNRTMSVKLPTTWLPIDLLTPAMRVVETNAGFR